VGGISESITSAIGDYGLYAVFLLMLVDAVFPAASELVMVYGGAVAAGAFAGSGVTLFGQRIESTAWAYVAIAAAGAIGYLIGSVVGWAIGAYGGRLFLERRGRWFHLTPERLERAERWFERKGDAAVLLGRVTPVVRSFVSIPAGVLEMPLGRYSALSVPGSVAWSFGFAGVGVGLGASWERFDHGFRYVDYGIVALIVLAVLALLVRAWRRRLRRRAMERPDLAGQ
jgi:membrane protein DedA with SNARE-associated domain